MKRVALSWLELILLILLVLGGMGVWKTTEQVAVTDLKDEMPREEDFQHQVFVRQVELSTVQDELTQAEQEALQKQLELEQLILRKQELEAAYPQLQSLVSMSTVTPTLPTDVIQAYLAAVADLEETRELVDFFTDQLVAATNTIETLSSSQESNQPSSSAAANREADLALAQAQLTAKQSEVVKQQLRAMELTAKLEALTSTYPQLKDTSPLSTRALSVSEEISQTYFNAQLELVAATQFIDALSADLEALSGTVAETSVAVDQAQRATSDTAAAPGIQIDMARKELTGIQDALTQHRLEFYQKTATINVMHTRYPQLLDLSAVVTNDPAIPPGILLTYIDLDLQIESVRDRLQSIARAQADLAHRVEHRTATLVAAQRSAAQAFIRARDSYNREESWRTLGLAALFSLLFLAFALALSLGVLRWKSNLRSTIDLRLVFGGAVALLVILFAYQSFEFIGVAVISTILLIVVLPLLSRYVAATQTSVTEEGNE